MYNTVIYVFDSVVSVEPIPWQARLALPLAECVFDLVVDYPRAYERRIKRDSTDKEFSKLSF